MQALQSNSRLAGRPAPPLRPWGRFRRSFQAAMWLAILIIDGIICGVAAAVLWVAAKSLERPRLPYFNSGQSQQRMLPSLQVAIRSIYQGRNYSGSNNCRGWDALACDTPGHAASTDSWTRSMDCCYIQWLLTTGAHSKSARFTARS